MNNYLVHNKKATVLSIGCLLLCFYVQAQQAIEADFSRDTAKIKNHILKGLLNQAISSVKRSQDTSTNNLYYTGKSEAPYLPYEGKIIRHINIEALDFERNFSDTSTRVISIASKIGNELHVNTKEHVIRDNLFIRERTPLSAYKVADNERFLRTLGFIHDARILIQFIPNNPDSIDLLVVTKDYFNISADAASDVLNHIHLTLTDANFLGEGQRIAVSGLYDYTRTPTFGEGILYVKDNIGNSFISGAAASAP